MAFQFFFVFNNLSIDKSLLCFCLIFQSKFFKQTIHYLNHPYHHQHRMMIWMVSVFEISTMNFQFFYSPCLTKWIVNVFACVCVCASRKCHNEKRRVEKKEVTSISNNEPEKKTKKKSKSMEKKQKNFRNQKPKKIAHTHKEQ